MVSSTYARRIALIGLASSLAAMACEGTRKPPPTTVEPTPADQPLAANEREGEASGPALNVDGRLVAIIAERFRDRDIEVVPLVQFDRAGEAFIVVWPAYRPDGDFLDDDVVGFIVADGDNGPAITGTKTRGAIKAVAQEKGWRVHPRDAGAPLDQLGPEFVVRLAEVTDATKAGDTRMAANAIVRLSLLLPPGELLDDQLPEICIRASRGAFSAEFVGVEAPSADEQKVLLRVASIACRTCKRRTATLPLRAVPTRTPKRFVLALQ
jgi:hypothetical protein